MNHLTIARTCRVQRTPIMFVYRTAGFHGSYLFVITTDLSQTSWIWRYPGLSQPSQPRYSTFTQPELTDVKFSRLIDKLWTEYRYVSNKTPCNIIHLIYREKGLGLAYH